MIDYYPAYSGLMPSSIRQGLAIERKALHRARYAVFCSAWAAESAVNDFELPRNRTHVMSFGPNLTKIPDRERALSRRDSATIRLLFLGVDWLRKGGPVALDTLRALLDRGKRASLTVCGCVPPSIESLPIEVIPFINKNTADGEARLIDLLCSHHFLLLPSLAECFGIVYCEAAACGTPSLAFNTGGIGGAITEGVSGHMIPVGSPGSVFADKITSLITHAEGYSALAASARDQYERSHNWRTWGESIANLIRSTHSDQKIKE
ncbi:MAG: glycosyltransferase family 4 protein [Opitutaceae bacterium]|nr:glycosyltransferase family 4 protein [Opitutaceae bacterium]